MRGPRWCQAVDRALAALNGARANACQVAALFLLDLATKDELAAALEAVNEERAEIEKLNTATEWTLAKEVA